MEKLDLTQLGIELNEDSQKGAEEILAAPLSECGIAKSGLDLNCSDSVLTGPLIVEIKEYEDITQPKQRFEDDKSREVDPDDFKKIHRKSFASYLFTAFDGVRDIKIAMILDDRQPIDIFKKPIRKDNKYKITNAAYINKIIIVRENSQISFTYEGSGDNITEKREKEMTGLDAHETEAPKFVEI